MRVKRHVPPFKLFTQIQPSLSFTTRDQREKNASEMSWNVVSNSNMLRVNSFNYKKVKHDSAMENRENFAPQLLEYMNDIFTGLDAAQTGYITVEDLDRYWKRNVEGNDMFLKSHYGILSRNVIKCMHQIVPGNGMFNFKKFIRGMKLAVSNAKNHHLRDLSYGDLKGRESSKSFVRTQCPGKPPRPRAKSDSKSFENAGAKSNEDGVRRPLRAVQKKPADFCRLADEESANEASVLTVSYEGVNLNSKSGLKKSDKTNCTVRNLFPLERKHKSLVEPSFEFDSFLSQNDTIDYTKFSNTTLDLCASGEVAPNAFAKAKCTQQKAFLSNVREMPRKSDVRKFTGFRKTDLDRQVDQASEMIRMMQRCMDATEDAREWYTKKISSLQQDRMELRRLVFLGRSKEETDGKINRMICNWENLRYDDVKRSMGVVNYYNEQLQKMATNRACIADGCNDRTINSCGGDVTSPLKPTTKLILEKMVEGQSRQIKQLEGEKVALVRDVFLMKGKLDVVEKPIDRLVPF